MIHHPPAGRRAQNLHRGLHDHAALAQVLGRAGAELVVHGHEHLDVEELIAGPAGSTVPVRGVTSGTYDGERPERTARYRIFTLDARSGGRPRVVAHEQRIWRRDEKRFSS